MIAAIVLLFFGLIAFSLAMWIGLEFWKASRKEYREKLQAKRISSEPSGDSLRTMIRDEVKSSLINIAETVIETLKKKENSK